MFRHASVLLCLAVAALVALGLVMLASTSAWVRGVDESYMFLRKQTIMVVVGLVLAVVAAFIPGEWMRKLVPWMWIGSLVLLLLCFVPGISVEIYGSKRWIQVPLVGQFQPSELAKIVTVMALAAWFARWQTEVSTFWRGFIIPGIIVGCPILAIAAETDVGTALSLSVAAGAVLYAIGTRVSFIIPTALSVISLAAVYIYNNQNRWSRIEAWLDLENPVHQLDKGMQQWRALLALGNGGPWGVGLGNGVEKFGTLTFAHIDFIFPVIGEELGLPFTLGVIVCYVLIAVAGTSIAVQATNVFNRCLAIGLTAVIVVPAMVNIGVTTAVLPNDGLPLPFVSYGGTSLVFSLAAVGLLVGIHRVSNQAPPSAFPLGKDTRLSVRL
jgi:cell division protein FtsW